MDFPSLHGNWVDLVILSIVFLYLVSGWSRGLFLGILDLGGFLLSFVASLKFYATIGELLTVNFSLSKGIANALGFFLAGFLAEFFLSTVINLFFQKIYPEVVKKLPQKNRTLILRIDKFLGFIPCFGEAIVLISFILTLLVSLPIQGAVKKAIVSSKIGSPLVSKTQGIERELNSIFGAAVNETLTFITINPNPSSSERVDLGFTQTEVKTDEGGEMTMLSLINQERTKRGLRHLSFSLELRDLARDYAKEMFAQGFFSHFDSEKEGPFDRMDKRKILYTSAGENLALAPNVFLAHQGLMNSPGHRANILSPDFKKVGIGVIDGGIYGEMFVQEFTD
jgi:uncharacterized protein YkwD